jgi:hypothetical protein
MVISAFAQGGRVTVAEFEMIWCENCSTPESAGQEISHGSRRAEQWSAVRDHLKQRVKEKGKRVADGLMERAHLRLSYWASRT